MYSTMCIIHMWKDLDLLTMILETFNPFIPVAAKTARQVWWYLSNESNIQKIVEVEMLIRTLFTFTTLIQIFCKFMLTSDYFQKYDRSR